MLSNVHPRMQRDAARRLRLDQPTFPAPPESNHPDVMHVTFRGSEPLGFRLVGTSVSYLDPSGQADTLGICVSWRIVAVEHVPVARESSERHISARVQDAIASSGHVILSFRTSALRGDLRVFLSHARRACTHALNSVRKCEWALWFTIVLCALFYLRFAWAQHVAHQQSELRKAFDSGRRHGHEEQSKESERLCLLALGQNVSWYVDLGKEIGRNEAYDASTLYIANLHANLHATRLGASGSGVSSSGGDTHDREPVSPDEPKDRGKEGSLMDRMLVNAMLARVEANVAQLMRHADESKPCRVLFADPFWGSEFSAESHDFSVPCPLQCEYVYGRETRLMNSTEADGVIYHMPNFGGFLDTKPPAQKWIGLQFEPETIYPQLKDAEIRARLDGTSTYGINSSIPVPYWTDYLFDSDAFTHAVSFARKKKV